MHCEKKQREIALDFKVSDVSVSAQIRGSVPLFWSQEAAAYNPKPPATSLDMDNEDFAGDFISRYQHFCGALGFQVKISYPSDSISPRFEYFFVDATESTYRLCTPGVIRRCRRPGDTLWISWRGLLYSVAGTSRHFGGGSLLHCIKKDTVRVL